MANTNGLTKGARIGQIIVAIIVLGGVFFGATRTFIWANEDHLTIQSLRSSDSLQLNRITNLERVFEHRQFTDSLTLHDLRLIKRKLGIDE